MLILKRNGLLLSIYVWCDGCNLYLLKEEVVGEKYKMLFVRKLNFLF